MKAILRYADGSITVTYSNGATVTVDYETETSTVEGCDK